MSTILVDGVPAHSNATTLAQDNLREQQAREPRRFADLDEMYLAAGCPEGKGPRDWMRLAHSFLVGFECYEEKHHDIYHNPDEPRIEGAAWATHDGRMVAKYEVAVMYSLYLDNQGMAEVYIGGEAD